ncbi:histidine kinase [Flavobacteriales bacterium]|nr:histidine kinase [Flavobacteriales bacterium]
MISFQSLAQKYSFISYSKNQGLAQSQVFDIAQDSKQYLWVATQDGLSKFDGNTFVNFYEKDGLESSVINSLFIDDDDNVWVTTSKGISIVKGDNIIPFEHNKLFEDKKIGEVIIQEDKIWISTDNDGIFCFQKKEKSAKYLLIKEYRKDFHDIKIKDISLFGSKLYVSTSNGIFIIKNSKSEKFPFLINEDIYSVSENSKGELWIGTTQKGIYLLNKTELKSINQSNSELLNDFTTNILVDKNDKVWVSSNTSLTEISLEHTLENYTKKNGFNFISQVVFEDDEGNIWIGTDGNGLVKFTNKEFLYLTEPEQLHSGLIISVGEDVKGNLWLGTFREGICRINEKSFTSYNVRDSKLPNNNVWTSLLDKNGKFWIGTSEGLACYKNNSFTTFTEDDGLPSNKVQSLFQEVSSVMWIGTRDGVAYYKNKIFHALDSFPFTNVRAIASTQDGYYWFGTNEGLVFYDGFEANLIEDKLLLGNKVYSISSYGNKLWIGTANGLIYYDGNKFEQFDYSNENNESVINFLLIDNANYLWIGTNNGVFTLNLNSFHKGIKEVNSYTINNGLIGMETNLNSIFQDSKNNIWFGTSDGINVFQRAKEKVDNSIKPKVNLTNVKLFFEEENWLEKLKNKDELSFSYKKNTFTFYYHSNFFKDPTSVRYSYKLDGANEDWSPMEEISLSRYPNLSHGDYTFMVKSTVDGGKTWSEIEQVKFTINPPFWLNWWFIVLALLFLFLLVFLIFNRRRNTLKKERELELLNYKNKLIKLEQQALNSSMNRHFIFNSLNSIQFYINKEDKLSANRYLSNFSKLIRKNLDSSTSEDSLIPLSEELERLGLYLSLENMRFKEKFSYEINLDESVDAEMTKVPGMFMQPFVENSIWHGILPMEKPGKIDINIYTKEDKTYFEIIDNGIGISTSKKNKSKEENSQSSQGMRIATNRIELLQKVINKEILIDGPNEILEKGLVKGTKVVIIFS